jgi:hypothetical protein
MFCWIKEILHSNGEVTLRWTSVRSHRIRLEYQWESKIRSMKNNHVCHNHEEKHHREASVVKR